MGLTSSAAARPTSPTPAGRSTKRKSQTCADAGIEYVELEIAIDGLTVATNPANADVECLDVPALYALIGPESEGFANWSDANDLAAEVGSAYARRSPRSRSSSTAQVRRAAPTTRSSSSRSPTSPRSAAPTRRPAPTTRRAPTTTSSCKASSRPTRRSAGSATPTSWRSRSG